MYCFRACATLFPLLIAMSAVSAHARQTGAWDCDRTLTLEKTGDAVYGDSEMPSRVSELAQKLRLPFESLLSRIADGRDAVSARWRNMRLSPAVRSFGERLLNPFNARARAFFNREMRWRAERGSSDAPWAGQEQRFWDLGGASYAEITLILKRFSPAAVLRAEIKTHLTVKRSLFFSARSILPIRVEPGEVALFKHGLLVGKITAGPNPRLVESR